jgi:1-acyl-sn-glycerol-3-phosphate acyltransferase
MSLFYRIIYAIFILPVRLIFRIHVENPDKLPPDDGFMICANHTSMLDVIILSAGTGRQIRYMAKKEAMSVPLVGAFLRALGAYPVDRGGADVRAIKTTISLLKDGKTVGIFPQGTRCPAVDPGTTPIKSGIGMIVWHTGATVVPAFIRTKGNRVRAFRRTTLVIGDPIPFSESGLTGGGRAQYEAAAERVFGAICALGGYERKLPVPETETKPEEGDPA